jgi:hypothetical protein
VLTGSARGPGTTAGGTGLGGGASLRPQAASMSVPKAIAARYEVVRRIGSPSCPMV